MGTATQALGRIALGLLTAVLTSAAALVLAHYAVTTWQQPTTRGVDDLTAVGLSLAGAVVATWYAVSATAGAVCVLLRGLGTVWTAGERSVRRHGAPGIARLFGAGTGAVLTAALVAGSAQAATDPVPDDLTWGASVSESAPEASTEEEPRPLHGETALSTGGGAPAGTSREVPDRQQASEQETPEPALPSPPGDDAPAAGYVVEAGDSLWSIAADALEPGATTSDVAAEWPRWYAANRDVIGSDPHLIHPGDHLQIPTEENTR